MIKKFVFALMILFLVLSSMILSQLAISLVATDCYTEKTIFPFLFTLNEIWSWSQFFTWFCIKRNSIWFKIEWKTDTTIISHFQCGFLSVVVIGWRYLGGGGGKLGWPLIDGGGYWVEVFGAGENSLMGINIGDWEWPSVNGGDFNWPLMFSGGYWV